MGRLAVLLAARPKGVRQRLVVALVLVIIYMIGIIGILGIIITH